MKNLARIAFSSPVFGEGNLFLNVELEKVGVEVLVPCFRGGKSFGERKQREPTA